MKAEEAKVAEGSTVLLTEIQNSTGDARFDSTTELVRSQLLQSPYFSLMDSDKIHKTLGEMLKPENTALVPQTAREIAMRNGVRRVVFGTVSRVGDSYILDLDIEQPDNSPLRFRQHWQNHWTWNMSGSTNGNSARDMPTGLLDAIRDSSDWIRHEIGESANDIAKLSTPPEDVTTAKWEALSQFVQAEQFRAARNSEAAVAALQNAVNADPSFALAYARLGDILVSLSRFTEGYVAYDKALALGDQRLTHRERDRIGGIYASDTWDYAKAEKLFSDYASYYPHDYFGWFYRATPLTMMGRTEEAIKSLKEAAAIDPEKMFAPAHIARNDLVLGDYNDSAKWIQHLRGHGHADDADLVEGESDYLQGRLQQSQDCFTRLTESKDPLYRSYGYSLLTRLFAEQGRYGDALSTIETGIKEDLEAGVSGRRADKILDRAYLNCRSMQYDGCLEDAKTALELDQSLQRSLSVVTMLGQSAYGASDRVRARIVVQLDAIKAEVTRADLKPLSDIVLHHVNGESLLAEGKWLQALDEFGKANSAEPFATDKEYLGRALLASSRHEADPAAARSLKDEAIANYAHLADHPGLVWRWAQHFPPGYVSQMRLSMRELNSDSRKSVN
jgi:tetratricopeptide (TPR) repeat protein